jgi:T5SS/PEP-CTERM-associated repeat protein
MSNMIDAEAGTLAADSYEWVVGSGSWAVGTNWGPLGPPGASGEALIIDGTGGTITGPGTANDAVFANGGAWTFTGGTLALNNAEAASIGAYGLAVENSLSVADATIDTPQGGVFIGGSGGDGGLTIDSGGLVTTQVVAGSDDLALLVAGSLDIEAGGTFDASLITPQTATYEIAIAPTGTAYVTVNGAGALFNAGLNGINVGFSAAAYGTLTIDNGGTLLTGSSNSAAIAGLSIGRAGTAIVTVSGTGSALDSAGEIYVGRAGSGTLDVLDNATLDMTDASSAGRLQVGVGGGATGFYTGGNGVMTIADGGSVQSAGAVQVGGDGVAGTLVVDAGSLQTTGNVLIGLTGTAAANEAIITASGTSLAAAATPYAGSGSVTVQNGGTLAAASGTIAVGSGSGSTGTLVVGGGGALVTATDLAIGTAADFGTAGSGVVSLLAGGTIAASNSVEIGAGGTLLLAGGVLDPPVVTADPGSTVSGFGTIDGDFVDDTDNFTGNGLLDITGAITGSGTLVVPQAGTLALGDAVDYTAAIAFAGPGGVLQLGDLPEEEAPIIGWAPGDSIDNGYVPYAGASESYYPIAHELVVHSGDGQASLLVFEGIFTNADFMLQPDAAGGLDIVNPCFAAGTHLRTTRGEVAVEDLRPGDAVPVVLGHGSALIGWIGHRQVDCRRHPAPHRVWPVRIAAGAFAPACPTRDLWLSPDHAVFQDGVLIPIKYLINGDTVAQVPREAIQYFHVELAQHDVLFAEGLAVESYLDTGDRGSFDNGGTVRRLHPDFSNRHREAMGCAPLIIVGPHVEGVRARLAARQTPHIRPAAATAAIRCA